MTRYFFDVHDERCRFVDQSGISLKSVEEIPAEVESLLRLLAYEHIYVAKSIMLKAVVRDAAGHKMFRATIVAGHGCCVFTGLY